MTKPPPFFATYADQFDPFGSSETRSLRNCQLGAYWSCWSHFTASAEPVLVSLPTGAGKTALMMALAFGLQAKRVLIVTPARLLRDQAAEAFRTLNLLRVVGTLSDSVPKPRVLSNEKVLATEAHWNALASFDVVTATPRTTSPEQPGVCAPPDGLFDLVFLDEAHHAPAKTWAGLLRATRSARCILLTATPFRNDKRRLGARLIYHYPIARALKDGIYRPVSYHPVTAAPNRSARDNELCAEAKKIFEAEVGAGKAPRILARAADVAWANRLVALYEKHGLRMGAVDYEKAAADNQATIDAVRTGKLDGMLCVGMLGEGLDVIDQEVVHRS